MERVLAGLKPQKVFEYFEDLCQIPHGSYKESGVADWLCQFAENHKLSYRRDALHNVLICKAASAGYEAEPVVMLAGHTDMVCVKRVDVAHDFTRDPLTLVVKDGWISAAGTSLGGDDGIAVAMMLAILDDDALPHPALECLFTVQEEVGLGGAAGFDYTGIHAALLYNLDSEEEGIGTVSCAGGIRVDIKRPVRFQTGETAYADVKIQGLKGGHSGAEIHLPRGNAHRILGTILTSLMKTTEIRLAAIDGGKMDNAIPGNAEAIVAYPKDADAVVRETLNALCKAQLEQLSEDDRVGGTILVEYGFGTLSSMTTGDTRAVLSILCNTPNGIDAMSEDMPGLVESSSNLGVLYTDMAACCVNFGFLVRASVEERKDALTKRITDCAEKWGGTAAYSGAYPGWAYDKNSVAAKRYVDAYTHLFGHAPRLEAIHAGLECGLMKHAVPTLDPISIGPDMKDIHTPQERISISSVERVYRTVCEMLKMKN